jgi:hypothetical protein
MQQTYARAILVLAAAVLTLLSVPAPAVAADTCDEGVIDISIKVSPSTLNLQHYDAWLTINTDIYYDDVKSFVVYLNWDEDTSEKDAFECWTKADELGELVAKCNIRNLDQRAGEIDKFNTFTLKGENQAGQAFCGQDDVMIVYRGPKASPPGPGPGPGGN